MTNCFWFENHVHSDKHKLKKITFVTSLCIYQQFHKNVHTQLSLTLNKQYLNISVNHPPPLQQSIYIQIYHYFSPLSQKSQQMSLAHCLL